MSPEGSFSNLIHYMDWMDYSSSIDNMFNVAYLFKKKGGGKLGYQFLQLKHLPPTKKLIKGCV